MFGVKRMFGAVTILILLVALMLVGCKTSRSGYESAGYSVVRTAGVFELRDYEGLTVVETPMATSGNSSNGSFNRLFQFISGQNQSKQKISMTTPVFMSGDSTNRAMAFVMPAKLTSSQVPAPTDPAVSVRTLPAQCFAVACKRDVLPAPGDETRFTTNVPCAVKRSRCSVARCFFAASTSWLTEIV